MNNLKAHNCIITIRSSNFSKVSPISEDLVAIKVDTSAGAVLSQADNATTDDVTPLTIFTVWDTLLYVKETDLG